MIKHTTSSRNLSWYFNRRALTLLELLVVLVILTIVATIAVGTLQPRVDAARFERSQQQLREISTAVLGASQSRQVDGTPLLTGFVADIGRNPKLPFSATLTTPRQGEDRSTASPSIESTQPTSSGRELSELWDIRTALAQAFPYRFRAGPSSPINFSDVQLPCGWRGPYLHMLGSDPRILDGWGKPPVYGIADSGEIIAVEIISEGEIIESLTCDLARGRVDVHGTINADQPLPPDLQVFLLLPDPETTTTELAVRTNESTAVGTFQFSGIPVGMRAICVTSNNQRLWTRYVQVPHQGLAFVIDLTGELAPFNE